MGVIIAFIRIGVTIWVQNNQFKSGVKQQRALFQIGVYRSLVKNVGSVVNFYENDSISKIAITSIENNDVSMVTLLGNDELAKQADSFAVVAKFHLLLNNMHESLNDYHSKLWDYKKERRDSKPDAKKNWESFLELRRIEYEINLFALKAETAKIKDVLDMIQLKDAYYHSASFCEAMDTLSQKVTSIKLDLNECEIPYKYFNLVDNKIQFVQEKCRAWLNTLKGRMIQAIRKKNPLLS